MTAGTVLQQARAAGVELSATPEGNLRWRFPTSLNDDLRHLLAVHKVDLVALLASWNQSEADGLIDEALRRLDARGWPSDPMVRQLLGHLIDVLDAAYLARDLVKLREAAGAFHKALDAAAHVVGVAADDDAALICRVMERDLSMPPGSLTLWDPIRPNDIPLTAPPAFNRKGLADG